jgi:hypothetical protein
MKEFFEVIITVVVIIMPFALISIIAWSVGICGGEDWERKRAIKAGVAEWRINPKTGEKVFTYLERENP